MTVTIIKRECDKHPGWYTMSDRCEVCIKEEFDAALDEIWSEFAKQLQERLR